MARAGSVSVASDYTLDVQADDAWSINVQQPKPSPSDPMSPQTFSGKGMSVSPLLARATGNFNGAMSEDVAAGTCLLDITADCNWTISVEQ